MLSCFTTPCLIIIRNWEIGFFNLHSGNLRCCSGRRWSKSSERSPTGLYSIAWWSWSWTTVKATSTLSTICKIFFRFTMKKNWILPGLKHLKLRNSAEYIGIEKFLKYGFVNMKQAVGFNLQRNLPRSNEQPFPLTNFKILKCKD